MEVTLSGISMSPCMAARAEAMISPSFTRKRPSAEAYFPENSRRDVQPENTVGPNVVILSGIEMEVSFVQPKNALPPIEEMPS